jgi:hypothetical protein
VDFSCDDLAVPARWPADAERVDVALYAAIAQTPTPALERAMARLSHAADCSRLSRASSAILAAGGGRHGRRAAAFAFATGVAHMLPSAAIPLRGLAALVAYSRVHYPDDVVAGASLAPSAASSKADNMRPTTMAHP